MGAGLDGIIFDDLEWPQPGFQGHVILTSRISPKRCVLGTKLLKNYRKPYTIYRMVQLSMTMSDLWPRFQGHDIFRHWISQKKRAIYWPRLTAKRVEPVVSISWASCYTITRSMLWELTAHTDGATCFFVAIATNRILTEACALYFSLYL